ncbi:hypothetical protein Ciccas_007581 [Cichlidogyrus casuarinus]|uniref:Bestrophin homolog n=1 Tax=Cichlidogyrus casuarinus TaxID=1844966 RepID=A0ABD2Q387_9PLAT
MVDDLIVKIHLYTGEDEAAKGWIPLKWCAELIARAQAEGIIKSYESLMDAINGLRKSFHDFSNRYNFGTPLLYTQTMIMVVYSYFLSEVFSEKAYMDPTGETHRKALQFEIFVPFFSMVRFLLFMGWLKSGLKLIYPMREDQSGFPTSQLLDYDLKFASRFALTENSDVVPRVFSLSSNFMCYVFVIIKDENSKIIFRQFVTWLTQVSKIAGADFLIGIFADKILDRWYRFVEVFPTPQLVVQSIETQVMPKDKNKCVNTAYEIRHKLCRFMHLAWVLELIPMSREARVRFAAIDDQEYQQCLRCEDLFDYKETSLKSSMDNRAMLERINEDPVVKETLGYLTNEEETETLVRNINKFDLDEDDFIDSWLPIKWAIELVNNADKFGYIHNAESLCASISGFRKYLAKFRTTRHFSFPLAYLQPIVFQVYCYFLSEIFHQDFYMRDTVGGAEILTNWEVFFPFVAAMRFFIFMGWMKVGLKIMTPLKETHSGFPTCKFLDESLDYTSKSALSLDLDQLISKSYSSFFKSTSDFTTK